MNHRDTETINQQPSMNSSLFSLGASVSLW